MDRNKIRSALLSTSTAKSDIVEIQGCKIEVRRPTVGLREKMVEKSTRNGNLKTQDFIFQAIINLCYVPGTDEKVFEDTDKDLFYSQEAGGTYDQLVNKITEALNVEVDLEKK